MPTHNQFDDFISQFVQSLQPPQTPQTQAVIQLFQEIVKPAFSAISDTVHTIQQSQPTPTPAFDFGHLSDFLHTLFDCPDPHTSGVQTAIGHEISEMHKLVDFHL